MKKALRHAMASTVPVLAAKAVKVGKEYGSLYVKHLKDVIREKKEASE